MTCPQCKVEMHTVKAIKSLAGNTVKYGDIKYECPKCEIRIGSK